MRHESFGVVSQASLDQGNVALLLGRRRCSTATRTRGTDEQHGDPTIFPLARQQTFFSEVRVRLSGPYLSNSPSAGPPVQSDGGSEGNQPPPAQNIALRRVSIYSRQAKEPRQEAQANLL